MLILQVNLNSEKLHTWKIMPPFEVCDKSTDTKKNHKKIRKIVSYQINSLYKRAGFSCN